MTSGEEARALVRLAEILRSDLTAASADELVDAIRTFDPDEVQGRLLAALHAKGMSWPQIAAATGLSQSTAHRRAKSYLSESTPP